jgi:hypothetical protein
LIAVINGAKCSTMCNVWRAPYSDVRHGELLQLSVIMKWLK